MDSVTLLHRIQQSGVTLTVEVDNLIVDSTTPLTELQCAFIRQHKPALLQALRQPAEAVNDCQGETVTGVPLGKAEPRAMATRVKDGWYAPNCNRCQHYRWRTETCQHQGRVLVANTPPCQGRHYQSFAPTLAECEAVAGAIGEDVS